MGNKLAVWLLVFGVGIAGIISTFAPVSMAQSEIKEAQRNQPAAV